MIMTLVCIFSLKVTQSLYSLISPLYFSVTHRHKYAHAHAHTHTHTHTQIGLLITHRWTHFFLSVSLRLEVWVWGLQTPKQSCACKGCLLTPALSLSTQPKSR